MAVQDGQNVNAGVTNAAFMSRLQNTSTIGEVELDNTTNPDSGDKITNTQRLINELKDVQGNTGEGDTTSKNYSSNNVVANGDDRKEAIGKLDLTYSGTAGVGHNHDGTDGNGAKVSAANLDDFNNLFAEFGEKFFDAASGTSIDVSALFASQSAGGDDVTEGVITSAPNNYVPIVEKTNGGEIEDADGKRVFARLTESTGTWTLSFFTNESGVETSHNLSSQDIRFLYREVFTAANRPTIGANVGVYDTQSAIGDIPDASATQRGVVSTSAQTLAGNKNFQDGLEVGGVDVVDLSSAQTMTNKTFGDEVTLTELGATPTTPSAGLMKIYPKTDKKMYKLDDTGAETELGAGGAGGGSGIRNFAQEFQNADSTTGYSTGQSATFDNTGTLGATFSVDSVTPIFGTDSLKLENIDANDWISIRDIAIDSGARGCLLAFKINYTYNGDDLPLLKVKDGDGNEVDENRIKIFNTTQDSKNQREAKCLWVQPQSGTASETVTIGFHFPNATGSETFVFDEIVVTDDSVTVIESSEEVTNEYSARIQNNGIASVLSENSSGVFTSSRSAIGRVTIDYSFLGLSVPPKIDLTLADGSIALGSINYTSITNTSVNVITINNGGAYADFDFNIGLSRQGSDVQSPVQSRFLIEQGENIVNEYSARIQNNGSASLLSESNPFIDSVSRTSTGIVSVTFTPGLFTQIPKLTATTNLISSPPTTGRLDIRGLTTSGFTCVVTDSSGAVRDYDFSIDVSRQGSDVKNGLGVAAIAGKTHENNSCVRVNGGAGFGSTNTTCRRFTSVLENSGSSIKYNSSATDGDSWVILEDGKYSISYNEQTTRGTSGFFGITVNSTALSTAINNLPDNDVILAIQSSGTSTGMDFGSCTASVCLKAGDVVRCQTIDQSFSTTKRVSFNISKEGQQPLLDAGAVISEDPSKINEFSARIENNGVASILSENHPFIDSVTRFSLGRVDVVFTPGLFSETPSIVVSGSRPANDGVNATIAEGTQTVNGFTVYTMNPPSGSAALQDHGFDIKVSRQGTDVVPLADRVSSFSSTVYKTRIGRTAVLKDVKASGVSGGTFTSGSFQTRDLNDQSGGNGFCSLTLNQFTLTKGTYLLRSESPAYRVVRHQARIWNVTDGTTIINGSNAYSTIGSEDHTRSNCIGEFTISDTKTFELQHRCQTTTVGDGFGVANSFGTEEIFSQLTIEKLD